MSLSRCNLVALAAIAVILTIASAEDAHEEPWIANSAAPYFVAISVEDMDQSIEWYTRAFGLTLLDDTTHPDEIWRMANLRNEFLFVELIDDTRDVSVDDARGIVKFGFGVEDLEAIADRVEAGGVERPRILDFERHNVRLLQVRDPDGNIVQLFSPLDSE